MKLYSFILVMICVPLLVHAYDDSLLFEYKINSNEYTNMLLHTERIINLISELSNNKIILPNYSSMYDVVHCTNSINFSLLCRVIDYSSKNLKKISLSPTTHVEINQKLLQSIELDNLDISILQIMQRNSRQLVKSLVIQSGKYQLSPSVTLSLQELYHALHEYKKQIGTLDNVSLIKAWCMYIRLLFLHIMLMQCIKTLHICTKKRIEQQVIVEQLLCMIERFKYSIISDF